MTNEESTGEDSVDQHIFQTVGVDPLVEDEVTLVFSLQKKKKKGKKKRCEKQKGREAMEDKTKQEVTSYIITVLHKCFKTLTMRNSNTETGTPLKLLLGGPAWWKRLLV